MLDQALNWSIGRWRPLWLISGGFASFSKNWVSLSDELQPFCVTVALPY